MSKCLHIESSTCPCVHVSKCLRTSKRGNVGKEFVEDVSGNFGKGFVCGRKQCERSAGQGGSQVRLLHSLTKTYGFRSYRTKKCCKQCKVSSLRAPLQMASTKWLLQKQILRAARNTQNKKTFHTNTAIIYIKYFVS